MPAHVSGDLRSQGVEQRRGREHRIKYYYLDPRLLGMAINPTSPEVTVIKGSNMWNDSNKYQMKPIYMWPNWSTPRYSGLNKQRKFCTIEGVHNTKVSTSRKGRLPTLKCEAHLDDFREVEEYSSSEQEKVEYDGYHEGVTYSFDAARGPGHGNEMLLSHAVSQAIEKFETQELVNLIKNEYDLVGESDVDEDFELV